MNVVQWNFSKLNSPMSGIKRYEDELFNNIKKLYPDMNFERIQRNPGKYRGSLCVSWFLRPPSRGANIVHATFQTFAPVALLGKPHRFVITVNDLIPMIYPSTIRDISTRIQWKLTPGALKKVDHIIAISDFVKKEIIRLLAIDENKITVVYDGVDHQLYHPLDKMECQRKFGLDASKKYILVVASNEQHKRMDLVFKIFNEIQKQRDDIRLIKIGYGQMLQGEKILNPGWVAESDMPALFNAVDVFLHTAEYEGFGLPVLEAMACGTSVVVSKKASLPEIVGNCGELIDLDLDTCVSDFNRAILKKIDQGKDQQAVERSHCFRWDSTALNTVKVYQSILQ